MAPFLYALTSNVNWFSKLFHCQNQEKICNNTITKDPTTPQVCHHYVPGTGMVQKSGQIFIPFRHNSRV